jgi:RNA polymerase sigma-70 factor (ECF subfamily)
VTHALAAADIYRSGHGVDLMWLSAILVKMGDAAAAEADRDAVRRLARGDAEALAEIYDRHARLLYSLALRIVRLQADAEDVLQEVFAQVWRQAPRYDASRGTVIGWLVTQTRSRALDRLRRGRARPQATDDEQAAQALADSAPGIDLTLVSAQQAAAVRAALEALPENQRVPLELAYYEGLSQSEIAGKLGVPLGTIKTRIRQALLRLREAMAEQVR